MVVYPGVIDTELFTLPDNDVPDLPVPAEPVSVAVDAILAGLESGAAQVYVPEWFHGIAASKAQDVGKFLEGTAAYLREQKQKQSQAGLREDGMKIEPDAAGMSEERLERITEHFGTAVRRHRARSPAARSPWCAAGTSPTTARSG